MNAQLNVPRFIRKLRKRFGLTQQELATRLNVALPTVSRWETGKTKASPLALDKIKTFLLGMGEDGQALFEQYFGNDGRG